MSTSQLKPQFWIGLAVLTVLATGVTNLLVWATSPADPPAETAHSWLTEPLLPYLDSLTQARENSPWHDNGYGTQKRDVRYDFQIPRQKLVDQMIASPPKGFSVRVVKPNNPPPWSDKPDFVKTYWLVALDGNAGTPGAARCSFVVTDNKDGYNVAPSSVFTTEMR